MIDPLESWRELALPDKPDYAGLLTYAGCRTRTTRPNSRVSTGIALERRGPNEMLTSR